VECVIQEFLCICAVVELCRLPVLRVYFFRMWLTLHVSFLWTALIWCL